MGVKIDGALSNNQVEVDSNHNLLVNTPMVKSQAGFTAHVVERDAGNVTGVRTTADLDVSIVGRQRVGRDSLMFNETFPGSALNSAMWTSVVSTMSTTVSGGYAVLNSGSTITTGTYALLRTYRCFPAFMSFPLMFVARLSFSSMPVTGNVCEWGLGFAATNATPTDGAYFRVSAAGVLTCVVNNNGTETPSAALSAATLVGTAVRKYVIELSNSEAWFWIDDVLVARIPVTTGSTTASMALPVFFRTYNSSATSPAQQMRVGVCSVSVQDMDSNRDWRCAQAGNGGMGYQGQAGGTMGSTALAANSAAPTAGVPSNTAANLGSGLGGNFYITPTLAVTTDGIVSSYQVPAGSSAAPGRNLVISGIRIDSIVSGALTAGPGVLQWGLAFGHTAVSLATAESATTKAPRRKVLGFQYFASGAAVGATGNVIVIQYKNPIVVQPGEFVQTCIRNIGTAITAGTIATAIDFDCSWE